MRESKDRRCRAQPNWEELVPVSRWQVSGLIVADQLPTEPLSLLDCTIAPMDRPRSTPDLSSPFSLTPAPGFSGTSVTASPPHIKFEFHPLPGCHVNSSRQFKVR